jgi:AcrR family transcriptional regulator
MTVKPVSEGPPRAARGQRRADLMAAGRACFAGQGVEGATVEQILARSGASVGSLYQHFGSKDGLAAALYLEGMELFFGRARARLAAAGTTEDGAKALVRAYFDCLEEDPLVVDFLMQARAYLEKTPFADEIARRNASFMPQIASWFREKIATGELKPLPPECIVAIIEGPARHYARHGRAAPGAAPVAAAREMLAQAAWDALRAR